MLNNSREVPSVRRAAVHTWSDLKEITIGHKKQLKPVVAARGTKNKQTKYKQPTQVGNSAGTRARGVQQSARGLA